MHLTLLVPELLWPEPEDDLAWQGLHCPALATLLQRGQLQRRPPLAVEAQAARWLGLQPPSLAALRLLGEEGSPLPSEGIWLCADPIHLKLHQEEVIVADSRHLGLAADEAQALADSLNAHYVGEARFHPLTPQRWYVHLTTPWAAELPWDVLPPLSAVTGRRLHLPSQADRASRQLLALMNEVQMLLHGHGVNADRAERGLAAINSLWLWGPGRHDALPTRRDAGAVWGNDPLARGLAQAAGLAHHPLPEGAAALLQAAQAGEKHLLCLDPLLLPSQEQDANAWQQTLAGLEQHWFAPLQRALRRGRLQGLTLVADTSYGDLTWELTPRQIKGGLFSFLAAKPLPLQTLARQLASA